MDYVEDYTLEERHGTAAIQQPQQNKKVPQDYSTLTGLDGKEKELVLYLLYEINTTL